MEEQILMNRDGSIYDYRALIEKMKAKEKSLNVTLPPQSRSIIRFEGVNFSSMSGRLNQPYDLGLMETLDKCATKLCRTISGSHFAYVQGNEISVIFSDLPITEGTNRSMWRGGNVMKIVSIGTSILSSYFNLLEGPDSENDFFPAFSALIYTVNSREEVEQYLEWRRFEARRCNLNSVLRHMFDHNDIHGKNQRERWEMLKGTEFENLPASFYHGRIIHPKKFSRLIESDEHGNVQSVSQSWQVSDATKNFVAGNLERINR